MPRLPKAFKPCEETADCPYAVSKDDKTYTPCDICPFITLAQQETARNDLEWIKKHRKINIAPYNSANIEWAYIIPEKELESRYLTEGK